MASQINPIEYLKGNKRTKVAKYSLRSWPPVNCKFKKKKNMAFTMVSTIYVVKLVNINDNKKNHDKDENS